MNVIHSHFDHMGIVRRSAWRRMVVCGVVATLALSMHVGLNTPALAQSRTPMLMTGKTTIYQRVLTRPGANLVLKAGQSGGGMLQSPMTVFYVYDRQTLNGEDWVEVGAASQGDVSGWVPANMTLDWKQQLTLAFTNPAGRDRSLMFATRDDLFGILEDADPARVVAPLRQKAEAGQASDVVVSIEPATHIDILQKFYLLPIMAVEETYMGAGYPVRALQVASVTSKGVDVGANVAPIAKPEAAVQLTNFKATVVFVIDSTISMGPYIDRTREAVRQIYDMVDAEGMSDKIRFGLVAYRSNIDASPGLEYVSRVYADPSEIESGDEFLTHVSELGPAEVSSARFDEDAFAGVLSALEAIKWNEFGGRYMVLITDAGAIKGGDNLSGTGLDAAQVRLEAYDRGVAIYTMHLKTPQGSKNHASAEAQYRDLSSHPQVSRPLYYGVPTGDVEQFGKIVDTVAMAIVEQVRAASRGELAAGSAISAQDESKVVSQPQPDPQTQAEQAAADAAAVGHAMQLAYLGRVQGTVAPPLFNAWIADRDLAKPDVATTEVRVLLSKNQLSDMQQVLQEIFNAGQMSQLSPDDFFASMRSAAAIMGRDPAQVNNANATKLADLGLMGEYLDDLPYKSKIMSMDQELWASWSIGEQQAFLDEIDRKLRLYQRYHDDVDRWVFLDGGAVPGDAVYPVPLEALP